MAQLWTPEGMHNTSEKDVVPVNRKEIIMLSELLEFTNKHQIVIFCKRCERNISGQNNDDPATVKHLSVNCQCREFRYTR